MNELKKKKQTEKWVTFFGKSTSDSRGLVKGLPFHKALHTLGYSLTLDWPSSNADKNSSFVTKLLHHFFLSEVLQMQ